MDLFPLLSTILYQGITFPTWFISSLLVLIIMVNEIAVTPIIMACSFFLMLSHFNYISNHQKEWVSLILPLSSYTNHSKNYCKITIWCFLLFYSNTTIYYNKKINKYTIHQTLSGLEESSPRLSPSKVCQMWVLFHHDHTQYSDYNISNSCIVFWSVFLLQWVSISLWGISTSVIEKPLLFDTF